MTAAPRRMSVYSELDDANLIEQCTGGVRAAMAELFHRYVNPVHRFVEGLRGTNSEAVQDLVQQTFIAAFGSISTFRGGSIKPWLFGIALNKTRMYARGEIRRKRKLTLLAQEPVHDADTRLVNRQQLDDIRRQIAMLTPKLREALVLIDIEGASGAQAAALLKIPLGTLWRRVYEARQQLRSLMSGTPS